MTRPPEPIRNFRSNVSPAVETVVLHCLEKNPADRWQSTGELVNRLVGRPDGERPRRSAAAVQLASCPGGDPDSATQQLS